MVALRMTILRALHHCIRMRVVMHLMRSVVGEQIELVLVDVLDVRPEVARELPGLSHRNLVLAVGGIQAVLRHGGRKRVINTKGPWP